MFRRALRKTLTVLLKEKGLEHPPWVDGAFGAGFGLLAALLSWKRCLSPENPIWILLDRSQMAMANLAVVLALGTVG